jgi:hypothetical protein
MLRDGAKESFRDEEEYLHDEIRPHCEREDKLGRPALLPVWMR